jgi:hypothetical protein
MDPTEKYSRPWLPEIFNILNDRQEKIGLPEKSVDNHVVEIVQLGGVG